MQFEEQVSAYREQVESEIKRLFGDGVEAAFPTAPKRLVEAMRYSLLAGGKRIRPVLLLATVDMLEGPMEEAMTPAAALEMIHTYSLIHDDLPGMDDDDYRRGRLTNHKVFGEGQAILAGDALLNGAYECMLCNALRYPNHMERHLKAIAAIAGRAGVCGMIAGQCVDLASEQAAPDAETLRYIHLHKTADLLTAPLEAGVLLSGTGDAALDALRRFGRAAGLAFQIDDDLLDIEGDAAALGKQTGVDAQRGKMTWPALVGIDEAHRQAKAFWQEAEDSLSIFGEDAAFLMTFAQRLSKRTH